MVKSKFILGSQNVIPNRLFSGRSVLLHYCTCCRDLYFNQDLSYQVILNKPTIFSQTETWTKQIFKWFYNQSIINAQCLLSLLLQMPYQRDWLQCMSHTQDLALSPCFVACPCSLFTLTACFYIVNQVTIVLRKWKCSAWQGNPRW